MSMLLAFISDIHANFEALESLSGELSRADLVLCLGDLVGYYCQVNESIDYVRSINSLCVLGNHDNFLLRGYPPETLPAVRFGIDYAKSVITPDNYKWLLNLPLTWGGFIDGVSVLVNHGSPWSPLHDYLYPNNPDLGSLELFQYDLIAFGQTHRSLLRCESKPYLLNPGSIGQSRDVRACACTIFMDTKTMKFEKVEKSYNPDLIIEKALEHGAGEWITKHLR
jgi:predicted phosphodiesterase